MTPARFGPDRSLLAILVAGAALRIVAVVGIEPTVYVDSGEYRGVALFGGRRRPWTVPLVHAVVGDGLARVMFHAVLGALAWAALAVAVAEVVRHRGARLVAAGAVMAMALATPVTNWDTTITSESVAVSLTVLLLATLLRFASAPSVGRAGAVAVAAVFFAFTRNDHPLLVTVIAVLAVAVALRRRRRAWAVLAAGLVVVSVWSVGAWRRNDEIERFNLALVIANRVLPDGEDRRWFEARGMPIPAEVGRPGVDAVEALTDDTRWNRWAADRGRAAYLRFLVTRPRRLLFEPWPDVLGLRSTSLEADVTPTAMLSPVDRYGRVHPVLPQPVEALLFGPGNAGSVLLGLAVVGAAAVARGRRALPRPGAVVAVVALLVAGGHLLVVWHASPNELGRLAMVAATTAHVATLVLVAVSADHLIDARTGGSSMTTS